MQKEVVNFEALKEIDELILKVRNEAETILQGRNNETKAAANRIWGYADKCNALIRNHVTPFAFGERTDGETDSTS
jgi:hypothetical protein